MKWLDRLKSEKWLSNVLPKPPKASYDSFGSSKERPVSENASKHTMPLPMPYLDESGDLVIPFDSDPKYHWWAGGQSITYTKAEIIGKKERP